MITVDPEPTANGFPLVNENALVWKGEEWPFPFAVIYKCTQGKDSPTLQIILVKNKLGERYQNLNVLYHRCVPPALNSTSNSIPLKISSIFQAYD